VTPALALAAAQAAGIHLEPGDGDRLRYRGRLSPELRAVLIEHKHEILRLLRGPAWRDFPWPDALPGLGPRSIGPFTRCARCVVGRWASRPLPSVRLEQWMDAGTFVSYGSTPLCLRHACELEEARA
jgi:hypothetical protein